MHRFARSHLVPPFVISAFACRVQILFAFIIETLYTVVSECKDELDGVPCQDYYDSIAADMREASWKIAVGCVGVIVVQGIGFILLYYGFGTASERMNKRVRDAAFTSLIRQEVGFYDLHPAGLLTTQVGLGKLVLFFCSNVFSNVFPIDSYKTTPL